MENKSFKTQKKWSKRQLAQVTTFCRNTAVSWRQKRFSLITWPCRYSHTSIRPCGLTYTLVWPCLGCFATFRRSSHMSKYVKAFSTASMTQPGPAPARLKYRSFKGKDTKSMAIRTTAPKKSTKSSIQSLSIWLSFMTMSLVSVEVTFLNFNMIWFLNYTWWLYINYLQ